MQKYKLRGTVKKYTEGIIWNFNFSTTTLWPQAQTRLLCLNMAFSGQPVLWILPRCASQISAKLLPRAHSWFYLVLVKNRKASVIKLLAMLIDSLKVHPESMFVTLYPFYFQMGNFFFTKKPFFPKKIILKMKNSHWRQKFAFCAPHIVPSQVIGWTTVFRFGHSPIQACAVQHAMHTAWIGEWPNIKNRGRNYDPRRY